MMYGPQWDISPRDLQSAGVENSSNAYGELSSSMRDDVGDDTASRVDVRGCGETIHKCSVEHEESRVDSWTKLSSAGEQSIHTVARSVEYPPPYSVA